MPKKVIKKKKVYKKTTITKKVKNALDKEVMNAGLIILKQSKALQRKNMVFPERYLTKNVVRYLFALNTTAATTGYNFLIPAVSTSGCAGINAAANSGNCDSLSYQLQHAGNTMATNYVAVGSGGNATVTATQAARGNTELANIYTNQCVYASRIKVNVQALALGDTPRVAVAPVNYYITSANNYQSDAYSNLGKLESGQYAKGNYFTAYARNKPIVNYMWNHKLAGVSKDIFVNDNRFILPNTSNQPATGGYDAAIPYTAWQVWIATADGQNLAQILGLDIDVEYYTIWSDQYSGNI